MLQQTVCKDEQIRRALIVGRSDINGIDYLNVDPADHAKLTVFFLNPVGPKNVANPNDPNDQYGLSTDLSKLTVTGGTRIVGIQPVAAARNPDGSLTITVSEPGDYSVYTLALNVPALDRLFASIDFSFMATCPVDFDCRIPHVCPPRPVPDLPLDYEAKDYASFRQFLLDLLPRLNPSFIERNPSDLGIALVELLAYAGDRLSYFQDAVVNEAYLDTLRHRISARRLAKLVDYRMHDGRNAWAAVHVAVESQTALPLGTRILSRIGQPLIGQTSPPPVIVDGSKINAQSMESDPALAAVAAFETAFAITLEPVNNQIYVHTWGDEECCLPSGTTDAFLYAALAGNNTAIVPVLHKNDYLLIEEVLGPLTGAAADADTTHRQVVMIDEEPDPPTNDPLFSNVLLPGGIIQERVAGDQPLPLLRVHWRAADSLTRPFCLSAKLANGTLVRHISVMRGNMVLADHGLTTQESIALVSPVPSTPPFRPRLSFGPLTQQMQPSSVQYDPVTGRIATARTDLTGDVTDAQPAISLFATLSTGTDLWTPAPDLLESTPFDTAFVAEIDNDQRAVLRFGDDEYGQSMAGATALTATYRIGNGLAGNIGAEALAHVAITLPFTGVTLVRNPLPARDGVDPETIAEVQQWAPEAFRAVQFRAVTEADYVADGEAHAAGGERRGELSLDRQLVHGLHRHPAERSRRPDQRGEGRDEPLARPGAERRHFPRWAIGSPATTWRSGRRNSWRSKSTCSCARPPIISAVMSSGRSKRLSVTSNSPTAAPASFILASSCSARRSISARSTRPCRTSRAWIRSSSPALRRSASPTMASSPAASFRSGRGRSRVWTMIRTSWSAVYSRSPCAEASCERHLRLLCAEFSAHAGDDRQSAGTVGHRLPRRHIRQLPRDHAGHDRWHARACQSHDAPERR